MKHWIIIGSLVVWAIVCVGRAHASLTPKPPTNVVATKGTFPDKVRITWNKVDKPAAVSHFKITRFDLDLSNPVFAGKVMGGESVQIDIPAPAKLHVYGVTVVANGNMGESDPKKAVAFGFAGVLPTPAAPTGVTASQGIPFQIKVKWTGVDHAFKYVVIGGTSAPYTTFVAEVGVVDDLFRRIPTEYIDSKVAGTFFYRVKACNYSNVCSTALNEGASGKTATPGPRVRGASGEAPPPALMRASDGTLGDAVDVTWSAVTWRVPVWYRLTRKQVSNGAFTTLGTKLTKRSFRDAAVIIGEKYTYNVESCVDVPKSEAASGFRCSKAKASDDGYAKGQKDIAPIGTQPPRGR